MIEKKIDPLLNDWVVRLALVIGIFLRIEEAIYEDIEPDEFHQWYLAISPELSTIYSDYIQAGTPHPSASFVLMWAWVKVFGDSMFIMRVPSIIFGILTILFCGFLTRDLFGEKAGKHALIMTAVMSDFILVSAQARMYSMLILLCIMQIWLINKKINEQESSNPVNYIGLVVVAILLSHTHYFGTMFAFGSIFIAMAYRKYNLGTIFTDFFWVMIVLIIGFSPQIPYTLNHLTVGGVGYIEQYMGWDLPLVLLSRQLNGSIAIAIIAVFFVAISLLINWRYLSEKRKFGWYCVGFWWLGSFFLAVSISIIGPAVASPANLRITMPATIISLSACTSMLHDKFIKIEKESIFSFSILTLILFHLIFSHGMLERSNAEIETAFDEVGKIVQNEDVVILANFHGMLLEGESGQCRFCEHIQGEIINTVLLYPGESWTDEDINNLKEGSVVIVFELEEWVTEYSDRENEIINSVGEVTWEKNFQRINSRVILVD